MNSMRVSIPVRPLASREIPEHFHCPLSLDVMADPVVTEHGQRFDRRWITPIIEAGGSCPLTRKAFKTGKLTRDNLLRQAIIAHPEARTQALLATHETLPDGLCIDRNKQTQAQDSLSVPWESGSDVGTCLLPNLAGLAHSRLSRRNLRHDIEKLRRALTEQELQGGAISERARLAGRIKRMETWLAFADGAKPVTRTVDFVAGTYTQHVERRRDNFAQAGVIGHLGYAAARCTCGAALPLVDVTSQSAALVGAGIKATLRLVADVPARIAARVARRNYLRDAAQGGQGEAEDAPTCRRPVR